MFSLHKIGRRDCHVVPQIVEAELVVRSESDVSLICFSPLRRVGFVFVDTIDRQSVEHIEWSHPLRVTFCQIVVDGHHVNTVPGECIEEYGQCGYERLTFTCSHLGDFSLMQHDSSEQLDVIVYHLPLEQVSSSRPLVVINSLVALNRDEVVCRVCREFAVKFGCCDNRLFVFSKSACRLFDDRKSHRHHFVKGILIFVECFLFQFVYAVENFLTLLDGCVLDGCFEGLYFFPFFGCGVLYERLYFLCFCAQAVVVEFLNLFVC